MPVGIAELLTASSVFVAVILGVVGFVENRRAQRRSYTVSLVSNFMLSGQLARSDFQMTRLINTGTRLDGHTIDDETDAHVINLLDYYEFLATAHADGALDPDVILHVRGGPMSRAYDVCEQYIEDRRTSLGAPNLYRNYCTLVGRYREQNLGL